MALLAPWWLAILAYILFVFYMEKPFEVIIYLLLTFALFGAKMDTPISHKIYFVVGALIIYQLILLVKLRMKGHYEHRVYYKDY